MTGSEISQKINLINQEIPANVELIAVTKQVGIESMRAAYAAGIRNFAENRLQEALTKQQQLQDLLDVNWHFIGHIQKNKAKKVIENFDWIHSVDSLPLAQRLNRLSGELDLRPKVLLQVKVVPDPNKYGWDVASLLADLEELNHCGQLNFQGLMTILPLGLSSAEALAAFQATQELAVSIKGKNYANVTMKELSMGMSGDYKLAVEAGSTQIRLGRIIFGEREN
ncbi:MAG: YggS family pyridoxal phosphate-dependent enzyme [Cyanobacteria bacterium P01_G01_bin.67]